MQWICPACPCSDDRMYRLNISINIKRPHFKTRSDPTGWKSRWWRFSWLILYSPHASNTIWPGKTHSGYGWSKTCAVRHVSSVCFANTSVWVLRMACSSGWSFNRSLDGTPGGYASVMKKMNTGNESWPASFYYCPFSSYFLFRTGWMSVNRRIIRGGITIKGTPVSVTTFPSEHSPLSCLRRYRFWVSPVINRKDQPDITSYIAISSVSVIDKTGFNWIW